jgi:peptidoglycan/LPS O-acetylase OafA/YrhL
MPRPVEGEGRYLAGLDGLRALAVLAVIAYHLNAPWASGGQLGVGVFFVLSGYLITDLLLAQRERRGRFGLRDFWMRRARRLLPALWVMLAVVSIWVAFLEPRQVPALRGNMLAAFFYFSNWWYAFQHVSYFALFAPPSPLGHLWSLAVEEQFYLLWPLLLLLALRVSRRRELLIGLLLGGAAVSAWLMSALYQPGVDPTRVYEGTDTRAFQLLLGAALAVALPSRQLFAPASRWARAGFEALAVTGLGGIVVLVLVTNQYESFLYRGGMVALSLASLAAVAGLAHPGTLSGRLLGAPPLRWIGVRSYGIYLWSYPIIVLTTPPGAAVGVQPVRVAAQLAGTMAAAALSWRFIEEPIRREGFSVLVRRLRAPRLRVAGIPAGLWAALGVTGAVLAASGVGLAGVVPASRGENVVADLPPSVVYAPSTQRQVGPAPWASPCGSPSRSPFASSPPPPSSLAVTAIGDSIMIDLAPDLHRLLPHAYIDGQVSRQMSELPALLGQLHAAGQLAPNLIVELGTNGPGWDPGMIAAALRASDLRRVVLVGAGTDPDHPDWAPIINRELAEVASQVPDSAVVDWYDASQGHAAYFMWGTQMGDGVHPGPQGAAALSEMIAAALTTSAGEVSQVPDAPVRLSRCAG